MLTLLIEIEGRAYQLLPEPDQALPANRIAEDRSYTLRLSGVDDDRELAGYHLLLGDVDQGDGRFGKQAGVYWHWDVRDYAGAITVGVEQTDGTPVLPVQEIMVDPNRTKLSREQFAQMVEDINAEAILAYNLSPATQRVELGVRRQAFNLAQLEYLRQRMELLRRVVESIARHPCRILEDEWRVEALARAHAPNDRSITWLMGRPSELTPVDSAAVPAGARGLHKQMQGHLPERLRVDRRRITYDVYENRLLKHFLQRLSVVLRHTRERLQADAGDASLDAPVRRLAQRRLSELRHYRHTVYNLQQLDFLQEVGAPQQTRPATPTLRKDPRYARFYQLYRQLDRAITPFEGGPFRLSLEKTWQLYEYWCFFQVLAALRALAGNALMFNACAMMGQREDRVTLFVPKAKIIVSPRIRIFFQKSYHYYGWRGAQGKRIGTYSHQMRPDISIEIRDSGGKVEQIIVLDPKYRVSGSSLNQAMDELHRYKDAIVGPDRRSLVHSALALCPGDESAKGLYFNPAYIRTHGLGAWVLRPGSDATVEELAHNLKQLIGDML